MPLKKKRKRSNIFESNYNMMQMIFSATTVHGRDVANFKPYK